MSNKIRKALRGSSRGVTLIEVLVALALFAIIGIAFAGGLGTASRAVLIARIRTNAASLAGAQIEYVKSHNYTAAPDGGVATYPKIADTDIPDGYAICSINGTDDSLPDNCGNSDPIVAIPWVSGNNTAADTDTGLQKITLVIKHEDREIITLQGYKVYRP
ncbi:MAG: type IV pilus modification PilV family protein [Chloroflexota bacterium]